MSHLKLGKEILTFGGTKIEKKIAAIKALFFQRILVSKKISSGENIYKPFIDYLYDNYKRKTITYNASRSERIYKKL